MAKRYLWVVEKRMGGRWKPSLIVSRSRTKALADIRDFLEPVDPDEPVRVVRYSAEDTRG